MKIISNLIILTLFSIQLVQAASISSEQSFFDSEYAPEFPATVNEITGHYQEIIYRENSSTKIDLWIESNNIAIVEFENIPTEGEEFKTNHKLNGKWSIRNGWVDLNYGNYFVVLKLSPGLTAHTSMGYKSGLGLEGAHALRSSERLLFAKLIKMPSNQSLQSDAPEARR